MALVLMTPGCALHLLLAGPQQPLRTLGMSLNPVQEITNDPHVTYTGFDQSTTAPPRSTPPRFVPKIA